MVNDDDDDDAGVGIGGEFSVKDCLYSPREPMSGPWLLAALAESLSFSCCLLSVVVAIVISSMAVGSRLPVCRWEYVRSSRLDKRSPQC